MRPVQTNFVELHRRLKEVLPEYKPISEWRSGMNGTYKATDASGAIYLVTIVEEPGQPVRRSVELVMSPDEAFSRSAKPGSIRPRADEGWNIPEDAPRSPEVERLGGKSWYDKD